MKKINELNFSHIKLEVICWLEWGLVRTSRYCSNNINHYYNIILAVLPKMVLINEILL